MVDAVYLQETQSGISDSCGDQVPSGEQVKDGEICHSGLNPVLHMTWQLAPAVSWVHVILPFCGSGGDAQLLAATTEIIT